VINRLVEVLPIAAVVRSAILLEPRVSEPDQWISVCQHNGSDFSASNSIHHVAELLAAEV
jgi:hypothetical protein